MGHSVVFRYAIKESSFHPKAVFVNGKAVDFTVEDNKYREGGAVIPTERFLEMMDQQDNIVEIQL
jgi:hypothetical protein